MAGDRYRRIRVDAATYRAGETVDALAGSFERMWALAAFDPSSLRDFAHANPSLDADVSGPALLLTGPGCRTVDLRRKLYADLHTASRVIVHAAYFLPSRELGRMLAAVALRGEVRILMPANSDVPVAQLATGTRSGALAVSRSGSSSICRK